MAFPARTTPWHVAMLIGLSLVACEEGDRAGEAPPVAPETATPPAEVTSEAAETADVRFLRALSDHHEGLLAIAAAAHQKQRVDVHEQAFELERSREPEQREMLGWLARVHGVWHEPAVPPSNERMLERLAPLDGAEYNREWRSLVIEHHREGIQIIDEYLPELEDPGVRRLAERVKRGMAGEIPELEAQRLGA